MKTLAKRLKKEKENVKYYKRRFDMAEMLAKECMKLEIGAREEVTRAAEVNRETMRYVTALVKRLIGKGEEISLSLEEIKAADENELEVEPVLDKDGKIQCIKIRREKSKYIDEKHKI